MPKSLPAVGEWRESPSENPGGEPAFCGLEALESLDGFESAVQLFVVAFDEIRGSWTAVVKELLRFHVAGEEIAVVEDVVERRDFESVVVVARGAPSDVPFQIFLAEIWEIEDLFLEIGQEAPVGLFASHFERSADVLEEVDMTELDDDTGVHLFRGETNGLVVVADECLKVVARVLELREVLEHRLEVLRWCKQADGNVVGQVVDAVDEGNLPVVAFDCHILSIDHQKPAEAFGIAVAERDLVVVRESIQFMYERSVGRVNAFADAGRERAGARALEMQRQQRFCFAAMINAETLPAIVAEVSFETIP